MNFLSSIVLNRAQSNHLLKQFTKACINSHAIIDRQSPPACNRVVVVRGTISSSLYHFVLCTTCIVSLLKSHDVCFIIKTTISFLLKIHCIVCTSSLSIPNLTFHQRAQPPQAQTDHAHTILQYSPKLDLRIIRRCIYRQVSRIHFVC